MEDEVVIDPHWDKQVWIRMRDIANQRLAEIAAEEGAA